jgi:aminoglycoside phosphotransferase (APT) family kinase protein
VTRLPADVRAALIDAGYPPGRVLGAGMEGVVAEVGGDLVVKTWRTRGRAELERLRRFYAVVESSGLTLAAPRILGVVSAGAQHATVERRLPGRPLRAGAGERSCVLTDDEVRCVVVVLSALRSAVPTKAMSSLSILEGERPFDSVGEFGGELADLVERRVRRFHGPLSGVVADLDRVVAATASRLREAKPDRPALIHGDLVPANILVDGAGAPVAIVDFGFFSTLGDPQFDAAVAASVHDMYGAHARTNEAIIDDAVATEFGYDRQWMPVYRAAYALATSNCYSVSGRDGHFAWCAAMVNRRDVREALDL